MKKLGLIFSCLAIIVSILALRPVRSCFENCQKTEGRVSNILEGPSNDIVFKLSNDPSTYYINRGLEQGLTIANLKQALLNKNIRLYFVKHWTPLDPTGRVKHIAKLQTSEQTIFSELGE